MDASVKEDWYPDEADDSDSNASWEPDEGPGDLVSDSEGDEDVEGFVGWFEDYPHNTYWDSSIFKPQSIEPIQPFQSLSRGATPSPPPPP